jgi:hypothetical integral membrane protein (TIGR02206 family)
MERFGPSHLTVIFLTFAVPGLVALALRKWKSPGAEWTVCAAWALMLLASRIGALAYAWHNGVRDPAELLPMQFCDWACAAAFVALLFRNILAFEIAYFWGLAGTLQAVLTPDLDFDWPDPRFVLFFTSHSGLIGASLLLIWGFGFRPRPGAVWRMWLACQVYLAATMLLNVLLHTNYGYLQSKPLNPSLMDDLGPWPWYIVAMEFLALAFFCLYALPFGRRMFELPWPRAAAKAS